MDKAQPRILLLDDEPFMLNLLAHILEQLGFADVTKCDNGPQALQRVNAADPPDVIWPAFPA